MEKALRAWLDAHQLPAIAAAVLGVIATVSVLIAAHGSHTWPTRGDSAWNLDGNADLWSFISRYHL